MIVAPTPIRRGASTVTRQRLFSLTWPARAPLRIAYFGSDKFSVKSLDSLMAYQRTYPSHIESVHVITRNLKPTGRSLKTLVESPIGEYCTRNDIPVLRVDTKADIEHLTSTHSFSLAIAVSFGLLIPGSFIHGCLHGGINVHPSLLPRYAGASPLQYALINDDPYTGCTIQTLHPRYFDKGEIILQSKPVPILDGDNYASLQEKLGQVGSDMLRKVIDEELFVGNQTLHSKYLPSKAPKVTKSLYEINWAKNTARQIKRLEDALGPLFTYMFVDITKNKKHITEFQRIILVDIQQIVDETSSFDDLTLIGQFRLEDTSSTNSRLIIRTLQGLISVGKLKFQACNEETPYVFLSHLRKRTGSEQTQFTNKV